MKKTMTREFREAVNAVEHGIYRYSTGVKWERVIDSMEFYFDQVDFFDIDPKDISGTILDHAFAEFHEILDVEDIRKKIAKVFG